MAFFIVYKGKKSKTMKSLFAFTLTIFVALTFSTEAAAISRVEPPGKNKVVEIRPSRPYVRVFKPLNIKRGYVWIEGHWKWNRKVHQYVWVNGYITKPKRGKVWVGGSWKAKNGGWAYTSGKWA